jgi:dipeptidyl aminopeptidase/acylaminoacyl peptidase
MKFLPLCLFFFGFSANAVELHQDFLKAPGSENKIEYFWRQPVGKGPWPVLLMIHPHQEGKEKIGGKMFVDLGSLDSWSKKGWLTVAISQPGYGGSDGKPDFCGPDTQLAIHLVLDKIRQRRDVNKDKIFLYGGSRGAVVAAMVATQDDKLAGVILKSGLYDFVDWFHHASWFSAVKYDFIWEVGWPSEAALRARSAFYSAENIKAPLLIIHGTRDDRAPMAYALALAEKVQASGGNAEVHTFDSEHIVPQEKIQGLMEGFLAKQAKGPTTRLQRQ